MPDYLPAFMSHAHADNSLCDPYHASLGRRGIACYYDRQSPQIGNLLSVALQQELERAKALIVMVSPASLGSFWVGEEIEMFFVLMARDRSRKLIPVKIAPCELPTRLEARWWLDATQLSLDEVVVQLARALETGAATSPGGPSVAPAADPAILPQQLAQLGFAAYRNGPIDYIVPPVVTVPAGEFLMGSDPKLDKSADDREKPQHRLNLPTFQIGKFPLTVAEYACFVRTGHIEPKPWSSRTNVVDWQTQLRQLDHPVVMISWHDAMAYAEWLAQQTGQPWRLPTEAEWEKAARGADGRIYPWGDRFDASCCNTREGGEGTTTQVGAYASGASPYLIQDMAGNVWEWTSSLFTSYPYTPTEFRENVSSAGSRVLRGCSWSDDSWHARAANRTPRRPDGANVYRGARLARAVPNS